MGRTGRVHDYCFQIHAITEQGDIVDTIGEMNGFSVAKAAFEASLDRTNSFIQLREGARIVETAKTGSYDHKTKLVALEWRRS